VVCYTRDSTIPIILYFSPLKIADCQLYFNHAIHGSENSRNQAIDSHFMQELIPGGMLH
jgi:hypothetical protein